MNSSSCNQRAEFKLYRLRGLRYAMIMRLNWLNSKMSLIKKSSDFNKECQRSNKDQNYKSKRFKQSINSRFKTLKKSLKFYENTSKENKPLIKNLLTTMR